MLAGGVADEPGTLTERDLYALERSVFAALIRNPQTQARIEHTLKTGRPLRN